MKLASRVLSSPLNCQIESGPDFRRFQAQLSVCDLSSQAFSSALMATSLIHLQMNHRPKLKGRCERKNSPYYKETWWFHIESSTLDTMWRLVALRPLIFLTSSFNFTNNICQTLSFMWNLMDSFKNNFQLGISQKPAATLICAFIPGMFKAQSVYVVPLTLKLKL